LLFIVARLIHCRKVDCSITHRHSCLLSLLVVVNVVVRNNCTSALFT
jgi:hypothetical protein